MGTLGRLLVGGPIAAFVTIALFVIMYNLIIPDEVELGEESDALRISINDEVAEVEARRRDTTIDDVDQVDPPPPPPQIERQAAEQPTEGLDTIVGQIPEFDAPQLASDSVSFSVSDRDAQPLVRIEPQYPPRAAERGVEGTCAVRFDVTPDGTPTNVQILTCSSSMFERASIRAVERWRYNPKIEDGIPVARRGVETQFNFQLAD
ncbi:energy transducer TonB [Maricaulis sp.]|uniref:energy transducer TonB n=1 Tax=Maricaulis sp. TaxID=1486257 RepID=UPI0026130653|nr:energy transducer TonB [Maricaulis sp.]